MLAQNMLRTYDVKQVLSEKNGFDDSFDVTKCLQRVEISYLLHMCAPCSKLPSDISGMIITQFTSGGSLHFRLSSRLLNSQHNEINE